MVSVRAFVFSIALSSLALSFQTAQAQVVPPQPGDANLFSRTSKAPDIATIPALDNLVKNGSKLYHMGERSSMHGWLLVRNGQVQMIYLSPDQKSVIMGGMFSVDGDNVTGAQLRVLNESNPEVQSVFANAAQERREVIEAGMTDGGVASLPATAPAEAMKAPSSKSLPTVALSPGESLIQDMAAAAGVALGKNEKSELFMVVAPNCPNCKNTWKELRDAVLANKVQVRLVPVYNSLGDAEKKISANLLKATDAFDAWDRFANGDKASLGGEADTMAMRAVEANMRLVTKWNIQGFPYIVYRAKDGRVKIVQGKPERMASVLVDVIK